MASQLLRPIVRGRLVASRAPEDLRGTAFGVVNLVTGVTLLPESALAGVFLAMEFTRDDRRRIGGRVYIARGLFVGGAQLRLLHRAMRGLFTGGPANNLLDGGRSALPRLDCYRRPASTNRVVNQPRSGV